MAREDGLVVITGGLAGHVGEAGLRTADWSVVEGMLPVLAARGIPAEDRIETMLPDPKEDHNRLMRFKDGCVRVLERRTPQARRFSMVHSADVVISVEGNRGTRSVLDVALAIERPILPLPFGGGSSREAWDKHRKDIVSWFRLEPAEVEYLERIRLEHLEATELRDLANRAHAFLMRGLTQGCFVIMPFSKENDPVFDKAICPALAAHGYQPWRTDRSMSVGDVVEAIRDGINHCYFAIADTTKDRPNVMYELGLAHATGKPVLLLRRSDPDGTMPPPPFDFHTQCILPYTEDMNDLRRRLEAAIAGLTGKKATA